MPGKKVNDRAANEKKKSEYGKSVAVNRSAANYKGAD